MDVERKCIVILLLCTYCTLVQAINGKVTKITYKATEKLIFEKYLDCEHPPFSKGSKFFKLK